MQTGAPVPPKGQLLTNLAILITAPAPSILFCVILARCCTATNNIAVCRVLNYDPLILVNALFFVNVCVIFWVLSLVQGSTWLIDPYWTFIPVLIAHLYAWACPDSAPRTGRQYVTLALIWLWSMRLTHSYFRREKWELGAREDWRYADMRKRYGRAWPLASFFLVYLIQQGMLVGLTLPLYAVFSSRRGWQPALDTLATAGCLIGISVAAVADNQLFRFMERNKRLLAAGKKPELLLNTGLWRHSRHPNYFFEQLFWWSLALFGANVGAPWVFVGPLFNTACMVQVTRLTEERMLRRPERERMYREYMRHTSVWVPIPAMSRRP